MKILVVSQHYRPEPFQLSDICEALAERGHDITVVTGMPNYPMGKLYPGYEDGKSRNEEINGVHVHRCALIPRKRGIVYRMLNYYSFVLSSCRYVDTLPSDFDAVYCHQSSPVMMAQAGLRYAKKHHKPSVLYCLDLWPDSLSAGGIRPGNPVYQYFLRVSRRIYRRADHILISSRYFDEYFDRVLKLGEKELTYQPQYAEDIYSAIPYKPAEETFSVMFAGNIGVAQSMETIFGAAKLLRERTNIRFYIVGDGSAMADCQTLAQELPNVTLFGRHPTEDMPRFYAMADAMLVTLRKDAAFSCTLPGKVQAYMAAGKPILAAAGDETARVIEKSGCGLSSPAEDAAALAENILTMAAQHAQRAQYGIRSRAYYNDHFSKQAFLDRLENALTRQQPTQEADEPVLALQR